MFEKFMACIYFLNEENPRVGNKAGSHTAYTSSTDQLADCASSRS